MAVEELYARIGGDYGDVLGRLQTEALVSRFVAKFPADRSCPDVVSAWAAGDEKAAFEAAHAAKGVCANLALVKLTGLASEITEALRPGNDALRARVDVDVLVRQLSEAYDETVAAINEMLG